MIGGYVDKLDQATPKRLIKINMFIFAFVCLAHGPLLAISFIGGVKGFETTPLLIYFSVPLALYAFIYGVYGLRNTKLQCTVLNHHTILLLLMFGLLCLYSASLLINGIPTDGMRFVWNPVLFAFLFSYPIYLARLSFFKGVINMNPSIKYAHLYAVIISIGISVLILRQILN
jgi:hypothetical protein